MNMPQLAAYLKKWKYLTMFSRMLKDKMDAEDQEGYSPFMRLILAGEIDGAKYLLLQGSNINYQNKLGHTALFKCI